MRHWVSINGVLTPAEDAKVSVFDSGFMQGIGLFETMRAYGGRVFRLEQHLDRLTNSARVLGWTTLPDTDDLAENVYQVVAATQSADARVRLTVTTGSLHADAADTPGLTVVATAAAAEKYPDECYVKAPNHEVYVGFLRSAGVDIESLEKDRRLGCLLISDCIVDKGRLSSAKAFQTATTLSQRDRELGFKGTRTITLAEYHPEYVSPSDLLRYENELGRTFNLPLSGFCIYNARRLVDLGLHDLLISLFKPHGQIIAKGLASSQG